jgi:hypothetical protein
LVTVDHDFDTFNFEASLWFIETSKNIVRANKVADRRNFLIGKVETSPATLDTHPCISNTFSSN